MLRHFFIVLLLSYLPLSAYSQDIADFSANYLVRLNGLSAGELKRELSSDKNGIHTFTSATQAKGVFAFFKPDLIEETSIWTVKGHKILSHSYLYQRTGGKKEKYLNIGFDWKNKQAKVSSKTQAKLLNLPLDTLDKLNYQIALMLDLQQKKDKLTYHIIDGSKFKTYNIAIIGSEIINTPLGKIDTIKLKRQRQTKNQRQTTLWCAPALNYLPVKIEHIEKDGTKFTAELRRLTGQIDTSVFKKSVKQTTLFNLSYQNHDQEI